MAEAEPRLKTRTEYMRRANWAKSVGDDTGVIEAITGAIDVTSSSVMAPVLNAAERELLVNGYQTVVSPLRFALAELAKIEKGLKKGAEQNQLREYRAEIAEKLWSRCDDLVNLIQRRIIKKCADIGEEVFYLKMVGDYCRYMIEACSEEARAEAVQESLKAYEKGWKLAKRNLAPADTLRLGLILNYSVFCKDIMSKPEDACDLIEEAIEAIPKKDQKKLEKEEDGIFSKLKFNLELWSDTDANNNSDAEVTKKPKPKSKTAKK